MSQPQRIQLSRKRGWRLPPNSVKVDRTTHWGNPFTPTMLYVGGPKRDKHLELGQPIGTAGAVQAFETLMQTHLRLEPTKTREALEQLRGKNLACWCKPGEPCHADVLLKLANRAPRAPSRGATMSDACEVCGCTDDRACPGGCFWIRPGLCSQCDKPRAKR